MMHVDINSCVGRCVTTRGKFARMKRVWKGKSFDINDKLLLL